jgi:hypothetical protein
MVSRILNKMCEHRTSMIAYIPIRPNVLDYDRNYYNAYLDKYRH